VGYKAHNLDQVLQGDLDPIIEACRRADAMNSVSNSGDS